MLEDILFSMRKYQKDNNIRNECITNTQFYYDIFNTYYNKKVLTVKSVIGFGYNDELKMAKTVCGHLVLVFDDGSIVEPSYDVFRIKNIEYYGNIKDFINSFKSDDLELFKRNCDMKKLITNYIDFCKYADKMNNDEFLITSNEVYNNQADYIQRIHNICIKTTTVKSHLIA